jgi:CTP synthase
MQCALIEFARNVARQGDADSVEFDPEASMPVIKAITPPHTFLGDEEKITPMRKGAIPVRLIPDSIVSAAYGDLLIYERFRHNYRVNNQYRSLFTEHGLSLTGFSPDDQHVEVIELPRHTHPWFVGVQFHPEFKSRITRPSPLFRAFIGAVCGNGMYS